MAVKGLFNDEFMKDFENLLGYPLPNGLVVNGVLGWLHAASDKLERETFIKIMSDSFTDDDVDVSKKILVEIVLRQQDERVKKDKELAIWVKGRNNPCKKERQIDDRKLLMKFLMMTALGRNIEEDSLEEDKATVMDRKERVAILNVEMKKEEIERTHGKTGCPTLQVHQVIKALQHPWIYLSLMSIMKLQKKLSKLI